MRQQDLRRLAAYATTIRNNTIRNNTIRNNTIRNNTIRNNTIRNNTIRNNTWTAPNCLNSSTVAAAPSTGESPTCVAVIKRGD